MRERDLFIKKFGWIGIIRLFTYPVTTLITTPVQLLKSIWRCRVLTEGKEWHTYSGFDFRRALINLFYYNRAQNLYKYGRSGYSPTISLGNSDLSRLFFYTLFSLYTFWAGGVVVVLTGMSGWLATHLIWIDNQETLWILTVLFFALISTTFYTNTFYFQNYNALGWIFMPLILYGLINGNYFILSISCFIASFTSLTVAFLAFILISISSVISLSLFPLIAFIPAGLKILTHFYQSLKKGNVFSVLINVAAAVGAFDKNIKYKRTKTKSLGTHRLYLIILYIQLIVIYYLITNEIPVLFLAAIILYFVNSIFVRFADFQSLQMLLFSISTALLIQKPHPVLLMSYWIAVSPLPLIAFIFRYPLALDSVPAFSPCNVKDLMTAMENFFKPVPEGSRILMAFNDPKNIYENAFDGYRDILELPLYIASKQNIHLFPDYQSLAEINYQGAPDIWGRDVNSVRINVREWFADYVLIYQKSGTDLDSVWENAGFKSISHFSWHDYTDLFFHGKPFDGETPDWWLLKTPDKNE